ncbi:hypothetical protein ASU32_07490 [Tsukamurella tyrosinosolvens]|nr:hypothetical protein ASU32_07490 [Tsukamurella tyrosinosolvens]
MAWARTAELKPSEIVLPLIAVIAACVATAALVESRKSANASHRSARIAEAQELRRRYGWSIALHPNGEYYELRNTGTVTARFVTFEGDFHFVQFLDRGGDDDSNPIAPGEARAFRALSGFGNVGVEVVIEWVPEGDTEHRRWRETLPPLPDSMAGIVKERKAARVREERYSRDDARQHLDLLLRLGDAYGEWKLDRSDPAKKLRVQLLTAALPPSMAREVGYEVDVARDVWGQGEYPLALHVAEKDLELIAGIEAEIELMWNVRQLAGYSVYGPIEAEGPNTEPRVWWAFRGYVDRVRERESGERRLRRSRSDQEHREYALRQIEHFRQSTGRSQDSPGSND